MYRKVALVFLTLIQDISLFQKGFAFLVIIYCNLLVFISFQPFISKKLNKLEVWSILVTLSISYFVCVNFTESSELLKTYSFLVAAFLNSIFLLDWALEFIHLNFVIYHKKIYHYLPNFFINYMSLSLTIKHVKKKSFDVAFFFKIFRENVKNFRNLYEKTKSLNEATVFCKTTIVDSNFWGEAKRIKRKKIVFE